MIINTTMRDIKLSFCDGTEIMVVREKGNVKHSNQECVMCFTGNMASCKKNCRTYTMFCLYRVSQVTTDSMLDAFKDNHIDEFAVSKLRVERSVLRMIAMVSSLKVIDFYDVGMEQGDFEEMAGMLRDNTTLTDFELRDMKLTNIDVLVPFVSTSPHLEVLNLSHNQFALTRAFVDALTASNSIRIFHLPFNVRVEEDVVDHLTKTTLRCHPRLVSVNLPVPAKLDRTIVRRLCVLNGASARTMFALLACKCRPSTPMGHRLPIEMFREVARFLFF